MNNILIKKISDELDDKIDFLIMAYKKHADEPGIKRLIYEINECRDDIKEKLKDRDYE